MSLHPPTPLTTVEINDALFCEHGKEVCEACSFDGREGGSVSCLLTPDNDCVMGYDPAPREPLDLPSYYRNTKDGSYVCKAHANNNCKQCCE